MVKQNQHDDAREIPVGAKKALDQAMAELEHRAARSLDPCPVAQVIALSDARVWRLIAAKLEEGLLFYESRCLNVGEVIFAFACPPEQICLIRPAFLVTVDFTTRSVREIVDPFTVPEGAPRVQRETSFSIAPSQTFEAVAASTVTEVVAASISGTYRTARISVDGATIPQFNGHGSATVQLIPPTVDVILTLAAPAPAEFKFEVTIRGRKKGNDGVFEGGKVSLPFSYKFSDFGLPTTGSVA